MLRRELSAVQQQLSELARQNQELRDKERQLEGQLAQQPAVAPAAPAVAAVPPAAPLPGASALPVPQGVPGSAGLPSSTAASSLLPSALANVKLWGYGEVYYSYPTRVSTNTQADLARAVFAIGYQIDSRTEFNSEYEVEHAVAGGGEDQRSTKLRCMP